jgi:peptide/nickel transport system permease protein
VFLRHVLRNALIPIISVLGFLLPEVVVGAVITEQVFAWPGMGFMAVRAAADRDPSMLMGVVLVVGVGVLLSSLLADISYAIADPRVRFTRKQRTWI